MNDNTAWITGANGLIGNELLRAAAALGVGTSLSPRHASIPWTARGLTRHDFDLTDYPALRRRFHEEEPRLIIHCAALSKSTACQANPALARQLNVEVTARLAELATDIPLIFFSTDLVFDGLQGNYDESAPVNPLSVYAETKVAAEQLVLANPKHTVIRTSLNGGNSPTGDRGFNEEMRHAWQQGRTLNLFVDEFRCPIAASETAQDCITSPAANAFPGGRSANSSPPAGRNSTPNSNPAPSRAIPARPVPRTSRLTAPKPRPF